MTTKLNYLSDTYLYESSAIVKYIGKAEKGTYVELDETIFYPQGGGQPSDTGHLIANDENIFVKFVDFENGKVLHYITDTQAEKVILGKEVELKVNKQNRLNYARLHSGGHLICHVIETMYSKILPAKGYHFPDGSYVELVDEDRLCNSEDIDKITDFLTNDIANDIKVCASLSSFDEVCPIRPNLASFIPKDKPTRIVQFGNYKPLPCGGTHVASSKELQGLEVTKIKRKKGNVRISYTF